MAITGRLSYGTGATAWLLAIFGCAQQDFPRAFPGGSDEPSSEFSYHVDECKKLAINHPHENGLSGAPAVYTKCMLLSGDHIELPTGKIATIADFKPGTPPSTSVSVAPKPRPAVQPVSPPITQPNPQIADSSRKNVDTWRSDAAMNPGSVISLYCDNRNPPSDGGSDARVWIDTVHKRVVWGGVSNGAGGLLEKLGVVGGEVLEDGYIKKDGEFYVRDVVILNQDYISFGATRSYSRNFDQSGLDVQTINRHNGAMTYYDHGAWQCHPESSTQF